MHSSLHETRLRQRTLKECLSLPSEHRDRYDVIEILSDSESTIEDDTEDLGV